MPVSPPQPLVQILAAAWLGLVLAGLGLILTGCAGERVAEENMSISLGPSPLSNQSPEEADAQTVARLGRDSAMPLAISTDPDEFDYDELFGGMPGDRPVETRWLSDHAEALEQARQRSQPMIVWFSNTKASPADRMLEAEVFAHEDFLLAARGRVVRVQLDYSESARARSDYYVNLKNHYGARGYPFVAVVLPDGTVVNEFRGYRQEFRDGYLDNFARSIDEATETIDQRRQDLVESSGYRWWTGDNGRRLFAHPVQYDQASSRLALAGMWDEQWVIEAIHLSPNDRNYLARWLTEEGNAGRIRHAQ